MDEHTRYVKKFSAANSEFKSLDFFVSHVFMKCMER